MSDYEQVTSVPDDLTWAEAAAIADEYGPSFFLFDESRFRGNFLALRDAFLSTYPRVAIGYSYKTNYTPHLCRIVHQLGGYAEVVSEMEYALAKRLEIPGDRIVFNGPVKAPAAFADAARSGAILNLDSARDLELLEETAATADGGDIRAVIRCNFELSPGEISRFGVDVGSPEFRQMIHRIGALDGVRLAGLHCHFPDRDLDSFGRRAEQMARLVKDVFTEAPPEILNIGGGYFSTMPESLRDKFAVPPASFTDYAELVGPILISAFADGPQPPTLFLEPGTAIVADCFHFVTRVVSTKSIRGKHFATVAGSMFDISPMARTRALPVRALHQNPEVSALSSWDVAGYTCIEKDILSEGVMAALRNGDFLCYGNVGSYSVVMRPPFILPANPILMRVGGEVRVLRDRQSMEDVFHNFRF
ncbi:alanine racemase [Mesorhizobium sp. Z1-4]|uniref:alanine racemase n=1 Tax=Mesorhizobium sp. Z1-4 TaxID=2448478 RepID=UPI000FDBCD46|nr:alanine racemase [Mesorhizobium sp. Z1-4]